MPDCRRLAPSRCLERTSTHLLSVERDQLEHHTVDFRGSPEPERWRELLRHVYDPFPVVEHREKVLSA